MHVQEEEKSCYFGELNTATECIDPSRCVLIVSLMPSIEDESISSLVK